MKIPLSLAKRCLNEAGAKRVGKNAQKELSKMLLEGAMQISELAIKNAEYFGRKGIRAEDIKKAVKELEESEAESNKTF